MCGIAGLVALNGVAANDNRQVHIANYLLRHRGPDDEGYFADEHVALGMRRLAIIDLEGGRQPMTTADGRFTVVLNGEIYNYQDLRAELLARAVPLRTRSDTEALLEHLALKGIDGLASVNGMFAFALWDRDHTELTLVRDRLGEKPIYYKAAGGRLWFASELGALAAFDGVLADIEPEALYHYLTFLSVPAPLSIYHGVRKLEPGHYLKFSDRGLEDVAYWTPPAPGTVVPPADGELLEAVRALLVDSVRRRLVSDVPLGAFLSGGLDSSTVVSLMARAGARPLRTFTAVFPGHREHDESRFARRLAEWVGAEHTEIVVEPADASILPVVCGHFGEPYADHSALPLFLLARGAQGLVKVVLSGDGGDEVFGGYPWYRWETAARWGRALRLPAFGGMPWRRGFGQRTRRFLAAAASGAGARRILWSYALTDEAKRQLLEPSASIADSWSSSRLLDGYARGRYWADGAMAMDISTYLPNEMLTKGDRMTMAHGLEGRLPMLDHRLVELCAALPASRKVRGWRLKAVLKDAMAPWLPGWVIARPKQGFNLPVDAWICGALRPLALDLLSAATVRRRGWLRPDAVEGLLRAELEEGARVGQILWGLMMLELWFQQRPALVDAGAGAHA